MSPSYVKSYTVAVFRPYSGNHAMNLGVPATSWTVDLDRAKGVTLESSKREGYKHVQNMNVTGHHRTEIDCQMIQS